MTDWFAQFGGKKIEEVPQQESSNDWFAQFGGQKLESNFSRSLGDSALRQVGRTGRALATGIAGLADIPNLLAMGAHAAGLKETPTFYEPIAGKVQQGIDTLTGGSLKPENTAEEYMDIIGEGLAPIALAPLTGGASLTGTAARGLSKAGLKGAEKIAKIGAKSYAPTAANIAQSAGSSAAIKAYLDEGGDPNLIGTFLASAAGGMGGKKLLSSAQNIHKPKNPFKVAADTAAGIAGKATGFSPEKYAQNAEIGLPVSMANVSKWKRPAQLEMILAKTPGSMGTISDFAQKRESAIAKNLGVRFPEELDTTVKHIPIHLAKQGSKGYHQRASDIYENRSKKFLPRELEAIANKELVDVTEIVKKLEHDRSLHSTEKIAKRLFDPSPEGILLKELKEADPKNEAFTVYNKLKAQGIPEKNINEIIKREFGDIDLSKNEVGYYTLDELRDKAFKESENARAPTGAGTTESREAAMRSSMLSGKRHQFVEETGTPTQIHNSKQARGFWSRYKDTTKDNEIGMAEYVAEITGADNDTDAFNKLTSNNPKYLRIARQGLSREERPRLASSVIESLGERQGRFYINTAHTRFYDMPESTRDELLKTFPNKTAQNNFERTMEFIGKEKKLMEELSNTSNTAHTSQMMKHLEKYGAAATSALGAIVGYSTGSFVPLILTVGQYAGFKYGAKIWTNQNFLRRMNDVIVTKSSKGKANKLDSLVAYLEKPGIHSKHMDNKDVE